MKAGKFILKSGWGDWNSPTGDLLILKCLLHHPNFIKHFLNANPNFPVLFTHDHQASLCFEEVQLPKHLDLQANFGTNFF